MGDGGMDGGGYGDTWAGPEISGSGPLGTITRSGQEAAAMAMGYSSPAEAVAAESGGMANITGTVPGLDTWGAPGAGEGRGAGAEPGELRQGPTLQKQKDQTREQIKEKRKRRRTLITGEEFGELTSAPVYRRSILGG